MTKPLSKAEQEAIRLYKGGMPPVEAYRKAKPIARRWTRATVENKCKRLFKGIDLEEDELAKLVEAVTPRGVSRKKLAARASQFKNFNATCKEYKFNQKQRKYFLACTQLQALTVINLLYHGLSRAEAYMRAGGTAKTPQVAATCVSKILQLPKVKAFYNALMEPIAGDAVMSRNEVLKRLTTMSRTSIKDIASFRNVKTGTDDNGDPVYQSVWTIKPDEELTDEQALAIKSVTTTATGVKIELHNQREAMRDLRTMQGMDSAKKYEITDENGKSVKAITKDMTAEEAAKIYKEALGKS